MIPVEQAFTEWRRDPDYIVAYDGLADEFAHASALIVARAEAGLTQTQGPLVAGSGSSISGQQVSPQRHRDTEKS